MNEIEFLKRTNENFCISWGHKMLEDVYMQTGEYALSRSHYESSLEIYDKTRLSPSGRHFVKCLSVLAKVKSGEADSDLENLQRLHERNKVSLGNGKHAKTIGEILLNSDGLHMAEAGIWIVRAINTDERNGVRLTLGRSHGLYAEYWKRKGDSEKTRESLVKAIEVMKECGGDGWAEMYEKELASIS